MEEQRAIRVEYTPQAGSPLPVNGAWGSVNPHGLIDAHLYYERAALPAPADLSATSTGKDGEYKLKTPEGKLRDLFRGVQAHVVMTPKDAATLGVWLIQKAKEAGAEGIHLEVETNE